MIVCNRCQEPVTAAKYLSLHSEQMGPYDFCWSCTTLLSYLVEAFIEKDEGVEQVLRAEFFKRGMQYP